jgi:PAS domain S-box-containing protein
MIATLRVLCITRIRRGDASAGGSNKMTDQRLQALIVDDDTSFRKTFADVLTAHDYKPTAVGEPKAALRVAKRHAPEVAVIDLKLQDTSGLELMRQIKKVSPDTECIVLTGYASQESAIEAVNLGAYSYVLKPYDLDQLLVTIRRASEKSRAERALRESEEKYRLVVASASEGIVLMDLKGTVQEVNAKALQLAGFERDELVGKSLAHLLPKLRMDSPAVLDAFRQTISGRQAEDKEWTIFNGKGERITFIAHQSLLRKGSRPVGLSVILEDVTDRRQAEAELRESEEKYRFLVEQSLQGMAVAQGTPPRLVFANSALAQMVGYTAGELVSLSSEQVTDLIHPEDRGFFFQHYRDRLHGEFVPPGYQFRAIRKDGSVCWLELHAGRIGYEGQPAIQAVFVDVSDRKQAEDDLRDSYEKVRATLVGTVHALTAAVEKRDPYTAGHQRRVAELAVAIAGEMTLPESQIDGIHLAGLIHDIGKIYVPAEILSKPSKLDEIEWMMMQTHPQAGFDVLSAVDFPWPVAETVLQHHERMDGSGYPRGLLGADIIVEARIISVADVVEAMASYRPYRPAHSTEQAMEEILQNRDTLYDRDAVDAMLNLYADDGLKLGSERARSIHSPGRLADLPEP